MKVILASASPRRKELLRQIGLEFEIFTAGGEEKIRFTKPSDVVMDLSCQKAKDVSLNLKQELAEEPHGMIGAETVVSSEGHLLGKPKDREDACRMLSMLQGRRHMVYTGVTILCCEDGVCTPHSFFEETEVAMYPMDEAELQWYINTGEPLDKAGGYGIQGRCAVFIREIRGDYNNVVGLPVSRVYQELKKLGIAVYAGS